MAFKERVGVEAMASGIIYPAASWRVKRNGLVGGKPEDLRVYLFDDEMEV